MYGGSRERKGKEKQHKEKEKGKGKGILNIEVPISQKRKGIEEEEAKVSRKQRSSQSNLPDWCTNAIIRLSRLTSISRRKLIEASQVLCRLCVWCHMYNSIKHPIWRRMVDYINVEQLHCYRHLMTINV